eukprot:1078024-Pleurochrysis_carterae.AAC.1
MGQGGGAYCAWARVCARVWAWARHWSAERVRARRRCCAGVCACAYVRVATGLRDVGDDREGDVLSVTARCVVCCVWSCVSACGSACSCACGSACRHRRAFVVGRPRTVDGGDGSALLAVRAGAVRAAA